jgi:hypothetical protein
MDGGVEEDRKRQAPGAPDILLADCVQLDLARVTLALLGHVHVEGNVHQACLAQLLQQIARGLDAVGEKARPHPPLTDAADDGDQFLPVAQRRVAARNLHIGVRPVMRPDHVDALEHRLDRDVLHRLRVVREIAERAVQVAALRDLQRHAADGPAPSHGLPHMPLAGSLHARSRMRHRVTRAGTP